MDINLAWILVALAYKLACLAVGSLFCMLGYRLFTLGIVNSAGDLNANWQDKKVTLKSAAPGTFFAILGGLIIIFTVLKGMNVQPIGVDHPVSPSAPPTQPLYQPREK